jgi:enoyl-CoA hydratase
LDIRITHEFCETKYVTTSDSLVLLDIADGVATITLNNPGERNTLTAPLVAEIISAMDRIENDSNVGAIVVTGPARSEERV